MSKEIKMLTERIENLKNPLEKTDISIQIPDNDFLNELYKNLKTFDENSINSFLKEISNFSNINPNHKTFQTMKNNQRLFFIEKLTEKKEALEKHVSDNN